MNNKKKLERIFTIKDIKEDMVDKIYTYHYSLYNKDIEEKIYVLKVTDNPKVLLYRDVKGNINVITQLKDYEWLEYERTIKH